jgi:hypothetical protein
MTLANILLTIKRLTDLTGEANIDTIITDWVNLTQQDIGIRNDWKYLEVNAYFSTAANRQNYGLTSDYYKITNVRTGEYDLIYLSQKEIDEIDPDASTTGTPQYYTVHANQIWLYPIPTSIDTIHVRYLKKLSDLSGSESSSIPSQFHYILIYGALEHAYAYKGDETKMAWARDKYERGITAMRQSEEREPNRLLRIRLKEPYIHPENYPHLTPNIRL